MLVTSAAVTTFDDSRGNKGDLTLLPAINALIDARPRLMGWFTKAELSVKLTAFLQQLEAHATAEPRVTNRRF